jgi:glycine dehydrogenase subunit 2
MLEGAADFRIGTPDTQVRRRFDEAQVTHAGGGTLERSCAGSPALPGLTEPETVRHYTRLSRQNYAHRSGPFPLGSLHDEAQPAPQRKGRAAAGFADVHPLQPQETVRARLR